LLCELIVTLVDALFKGLWNDYHGRTVDKQPAIADSLGCSCETWSETHHFGDVGQHPRDPLETLFENRYMRSPSVKTKSRVGISHFRLRFNRNNPNGRVRCGVMGLERISYSKDEAKRKLLQLGIAHLPDPNTNASRASYEPLTPRDPKRKTQKQNPKTMRRTDSP
jgi:hypothetical protein